MKYKFFTISALDPEWGEGELNHFIASHKTVSVEKHFVDLAHGGYWSFIVTYLEAAPSQADDRKRSSVDYKEILNDDDFKRFVKLREYRNNLAKEEGKPAYAIFTNEQLAKMVVDRVVCRTAMAGIQGVGESRMGMYSEKFLTLLQELHGEREK